MKYSTIVVDPPWPDQGRGPDWGSGGSPKPVTDYYPCMSFDEINALSVRDIAEKDAHLYLWTCNRYILNAYDACYAWGFKPSVLLTWCKPAMGIGLGGTFVQTSEHILFCRRGSLAAKQRVDRTWFEWPRRKHSQKPDEFMELVESVSPGPYVELFARRARAGWDRWGNQIDSTIEVNK